MPKLYAFRPRGHGEESFYVMANSEEEARANIEKKIQKLQFEDESSPFYHSDYWFAGWGTEYYYMEIYEVGEVAMHEND